MTDDNSKRGDTAAARGDNPLFKVPLRADYGSGAFRRRIRLCATPGAVRAEMEDMYHGICCTLRHDGEVITDISADFPRIQLSTCGGAGAPIKALIGQALDTPADALGRHAKPRRNCTHLLDIALLAVAHARRGGTRQYDIVITDETAQPASARIWRNDQLVLEWQLRGGVFVAPQPLRDQAVLQGFFNWAPRLYRGDDLEAARVLQKGCFVGGMRRYDIAALGDRPAALDTGMLGSCYSYSPGAVEHAVRVHGSERDFSDNPEALLRFV
jgi:hypothetical protein